MMEELDIQPIDLVQMSRAQFIVNCVNDVVYGKLTYTFPEFQLRPTEHFVLQGSVADGTKVSAPDEFDYMIPMDLCEQCFEIVKTTDELYYIQRRNNPDHEFCKDSTDILSICEQDKPADDNCNQWKEGRISAIKVYERCLTSIKELENRRGLEKINKSYSISYVRGVAHGPAVTASVPYKSNECPDATLLILDIDYVPAVCIGGRYFVCAHVPYYGLKTSDTDDTRNSLERLKQCSEKCWRESFAHKELELMNEIKQQTPALFEVYKSFKALVAHFNHINNDKYESLHEMERNLTEEEYYIKNIQTNLISYSQRSELARPLNACLPKYIVLMLDQETCHLKSVLFHLWGREELREADLQTLAAEYVTSLNECIDRRYFINYFTGKEFGGNLRKWKYRSYSADRFREALFENCDRKSCPRKLFLYSVITSRQSAEMKIFAEKQKTNIYRSIKEWQKSTTKTSANFN